MEFVVEKAPFVAMAERVLKCVERKDSIPVLTMFKIEASEGKITVSGTNLDMAARADVPAEVKKPGSACIPADLLTRSIKGSRGTEVTFAADTKRVSVTSGRSKFKLDVLPGEDFPDAGMLDKDGAHIVPLADGLIERIASEIVPAASDDPTRSYLCGVFLNVTSAGIDFVSTDGKMLAKLTVAKPSGLAMDRGIIIPSRAFGIAQDAERAVISDYFIRFEGAGIVSASKLVEGAFPPYQLIIEQIGTPDKSVIVDSAELAAAFGRVSPFSEGGKAVAMALRVSDGEMRIEGMSQRGEAEDVIAVDGDASFEIGMSLKVIGPLVGGFSGETVRLHVSDHKTPMVITDPLDESRYALAFPYALRQPVSEAVAEAA